MLLIGFLKTKEIIRCEVSGMFIVVIKTFRPCTKPSFFNHSPHNLISGTFFDANTLSLKRGWILRLECVHASLNSSHRLAAFNSAQVVPIGADMRIDDSRECLLETVSNGFFAYIFLLDFLEILAITENSFN